MRKLLILFLFFSFLNPPISIAELAAIKIVDFRVQALYRAAKLNWKVKGDLKNPITLQIMRADTFVEGPYKEVEVITLTPGKNSYEYVDKTMGAEATYH